MQDISLFSRIMMAGRGAISAFRRLWADPSVRDASMIGLHQSRAAFLWGWYTNSVFDTILESAGYRQYYNLYRNTRSIINPVQRCVDFYASHVYPGVLTIDASELPDGTQVAIPLSRNTSDQTKAALSEWWRLANWQVQKNTMVRFGAIAGDVLVVLADEWMYRRVTAEVVWPGEITNIETDSTGAVTCYRREYTVRDDAGTYKYGKEVTPWNITTFRDDEIEWSEPNPYGFVPAVWVKHRDIGGIFGEPAIAGVLPKLDEGNQYISLLVDRSRKVVESPVIITAPNALTSLVQKVTGKVQNTNGEIDPAQDTKSDDRDVIRTLRLPQGTDIKSIPMDLQHALAVLGLLMQEVEADLPELTMYRELRAMSQITGPAAERLIGDVQAKVNEPAANYDRESERLFSMALAISGWRANTGAWGPNLTERERLFLPFDLTTYTDDIPDVHILPRTLLPTLRSEKVNAVGQEQKIGVSQDHALRTLGYSDEQIAQFNNENMAMNERQTTAMERMLRGG